MMGLPLVGLIAVAQIILPGIARLHIGHILGPFAVVFVQPSFRIVIAMRNVVRQTAGNVDIALGIMEKRQSASAFHIQLMPRGCLKGIFIVGVYL